MKIGTVPCLVVVHGADEKRLAAGQWVRVKECEGDKWHQVYVEHIDGDGNIFASR
jgi:hypothetical protein